MEQIRVYIPNLIQRTDRKSSIIKQFEGKKVFDVYIICPVYDEVAHNSLWKTFYDIVRKEAEMKSEFFIFCEDDHVFTKEYSEQFLLKQIFLAKELGADILSGGMSWHDMVLQVKNDLFWVNRFNGMQFTIIFQHFYEKILLSDRDADRITDNFLSTLTDSIFVTFPYISIQKEFGYSDVTKGNNEEGYVKGLFEKTENSLAILNKVRNYYGKSFNGL